MAAVHELKQPEPQTDECFCWLQLDFRYLEQQTITERFHLSVLTEDVQENSNQTSGALSALEVPYILIVP